MSDYFVNFSGTGRAKCDTGGMFPMFDGHDIRWKKGKPLMKGLFGIPYKQAMSDSDFIAFQVFIDEVFCASNWPRDNFERHVEFLQMVRKSYTGSSELGFNVPWRILKANYDRDNTNFSSREFDKNDWASPPRKIPAFQEMDGKCYISFIKVDILKVGKRVSDWVEFTQDFVRSIAE